MVIALHGGPGNDYRYILPLKELADEYFVVFYDQRGTGLSPRVTAKEFTLEIMLSDLHDIIEYYAKDRKVNLIGHSWGVCWLPDTCLYILKALKKLCLLNRDC